MTADLPASTPVAPLTPRTAAPARRRVLAQARFEAGTLLRNGEQLLVSLLLPAMVLVGVHASTSPSLGPGRRIDVAVPGVLALCVISSAFTSQAISTGFDRRYSVLRYLGVTPLGRGGLIAAKVVATLLVELLQVVVLGGLGLALGWQPSLAGIPYAVVFLVVGTWTFVALALLLAGTVRAEAVLALANLIWVLLLVLGGVVVPRTELPGSVGGVAALLPSAGLADGLRSALVLGRLNVPALVVLLGWATIATALAARFFRFDD
ncbi:ABC transporter [Intrasporangium oryzae NRRL B-24470]|uniref:ABC transporter n=1 Tax=Intrasporangium oryzae NRRL B-24470 TaxID=1386089 RepID=W9G995_9MICO|nr:ABC transporter permease [Intrasporangium oryzae]EWT01822.1 ABC transporter [Intrasporangium oryzae NRRL B-24470]